MTEVWFSIGARCSVYPCDHASSVTQVPIQWAPWDLRLEFKLTSIFFFFFNFYLLHAPLQSVILHAHLHLLSRLPLQGFLFCHIQIDSKIGHTYGRCFDPFRILQILCVKSVLEEMLHSCKYRLIWEGAILEVSTDTYSMIKVYLIGAT